MQLMLIKGGMR